MGRIFRRKEDALSFQLLPCAGEFASLLLNLAKNFLRLRLATLSFGATATHFRFHFDELLLKLGIDPPLRVHFRLDSSFQAIEVAVDRGANCLQASNHRLGDWGGRTIVGRTPTRSNLS